ncbi:MAG TPA: hypothetical protein VFE79_21130 [Paraburkholderia sp.]|nr:hypothetical protein [Paraburkholderia sp.]
MQRIIAAHTPERSITTWTKRMSLASPGDREDKRGKTRSAGAPSGQTVGQHEYPFDADEFALLLFPERFGCKLLSHKGRFAGIS